MDFFNKIAKKVINFAFKKIVCILKNSEFNYIRFTQIRDCYSSLEFNLTSRPSRKLV